MQVLGMTTSVTRRDFLDGIAIGVGAAAAGAVWPGFAALADGAQDAAGYYPPALTGLRGNQPGSF